MNGQVVTIEVNHSDVRRVAQKVLDALATENLQGAALGAGLAFGGLLRASNPMTVEEEIRFVQALGAWSAAYFQEGGES